MSLALRRRRVRDVLLVLDPAGSLVPWPMLLLKASGGDSVEIPGGILVPASKPEQESCVGFAAFSAAATSAASFSSSSCLPIRRTVSKEDHLYIGNTSSARAIACFVGFRLSAGGDAIFSAGRRGGKPMIGTFLSHEQGGTFGNPAGASAGN